MTLVLKFSPIYCIKNHKNQRNDDVIITPFLTSYSSVISPRMDGSCLKCYQRENRNITVLCSYRNGIDLRSRFNARLWFKLYRSRYFLEFVQGERISGRFPWRECLHRGVRRAGCFVWPVYGARHQFFRGNTSQYRKVLSVLRLLLEKTISLISIKKDQ